MLVKIDKMGQVFVRPHHRSSWYWDPFGYYGPHHYGHYHHQPLVIHEHYGRSGRSYNNRRGSTFNSPSSGDSIPSINTGSSVANSVTSNTGASVPNMGMSNMGASVPNMGNMSMGNTGNMGNSGSPGQNFTGGRKNKSRKNRTKHNRTRRSRK